MGAVLSDIINPMGSRNKNAGALFVYIYLLRAKLCR